MFNRQKGYTYKKLFSATWPIKILLLECIFTYIFNSISGQNCLDKPVLNNVNRLNNSSPMNNTTILLQTKSNKYS